MADGTAARRPALDRITTPSNAKVAASSCPAAARLIFRGAREAAAICGSAFGVALSTRPMRTNQNGARAALWLSTDEWLLLIEDADVESVRATLEAALGAAPHSLVDVSHRNVAFDIEGSGAARLLNAGIMLDLDLGAFPVGMSTRTAFVKADVTLWRRAEQHFRLECGRSFGPYVAAILTQAAGDQELC
jgi:sarcosine oxidase subunit gamma